MAAVLCLGASVAFGASSTFAEAKAKAVIGDAQVSNWVRLWQKRLHLEDWKVEVRIVPATDLRPDTLGNLKWNSLARTAVIKVLSPADYEIPAAEVAEDMEYTVVHELVHLQLSALPRDLNRKDVEEQVVNKIADALMLLERGESFRGRSQPVVPHAGPPDPPMPDAAGRQARRPGPLP